MKEVLQCINNVKSNELRSIVDNRIKEFKSIDKKNNDELFKEICFCIMTANFNAEGGIRIQKAIGDGFIKLNEQQLAKKLKELGHRFPNTRAKYMIASREYKQQLKDVLSGKDSEQIREWLVEHIKGLGYKEASHFLRNVGFDDYAIIDFHIVDFLVKYKMIEEPKTLTKNKYIEIEKVLRKIAKHSNMTLAELDLYMWYCETGTVLK